MIFIKLSNCILKKVIIQQFLGFYVYYVFTLGTAGPILIEIDMKVISTLAYTQKFIPKNFSISMGYPTSINVVDTSTL